MQAQMQLRVLSWRDGTAASGVYMRSTHPPITPPSPDIKLIIASIPQYICIGVMGCVAGSYSWPGDGQLFVHQVGCTTQSHYLHPLII